MNFFKGVLFGTVLSAGAMMLYSEMGKSNKKNMMKKIWGRMLIAVSKDRRKNGKRNSYM